MNNPMINKGDNCFTGGGVYVSPTIDRTAEVAALQEALTRMADSYGDLLAVNQELQREAALRRKQADCWKQLARLVVGIAREARAGR